jgi:ethanolamine utilization protein EutM
MRAKALGIIEAIGLAAAIEAADAAAKAANVTVLGYENAKGGGRIAVKFVGDVGAVKAAISAGAAAALRVGKVAGCLVIPRPHEEIEALIAQIDRGRGRPASIDGTAASIDGAAASIDGAAASIDGTAASIDGAAASIDGTAASIDGTAASIDGTAASTDGTAASTDGTAASTDGTAASTDGTAASTDGTAASTDGTAASIETDSASETLSERRRPAPAKRPKTPKSDQPTTQDPGEVEG